MDRCRRCFSITQTPNLEDPPPPPPPPPHPLSCKSLYMALFSFVNDTIAICLFFSEDRAISNMNNNNKKGSKWRSDKEKEAHRSTRSGVRGYGSQGQESDKEGKKVKQKLNKKEEEKNPNPPFSFPAERFALDALGGVCGAADAGQVKQRPGCLLELLIQLQLHLLSCPLPCRPLGSSGGGAADRGGGGSRGGGGGSAAGRGGRAGAAAPLVPEVRVLVTVEALAAGPAPAALALLAAPLVQRGQGGRGGAGGAALQAPRCCCCSCGPVWGRCSPGPSLAARGPAGCLSRLGDKRRGEMMGGD